MQDFSFPLLISHARLVKVTPKIPNYEKGEEHLQKKKEEKTFDKGRTNVKKKKKCSRISIYFFSARSSHAATFSRRLFFFL